MGSIQNRSPQTQISLFKTFQPKYTSQKIGLGRSGMVESHGVCNVGFWICYYEPSQTKSPLLHWQWTQVAHLSWWPKYEFSREIKWEYISTEFGGKAQLHMKLVPPTLKGSPELKKEQELYTRCQDPDSFVSWLWLPWWMRIFVKSHTDSIIRLWLALKAVPTQEPICKWFRMHRFYS